MLEEGVTLTTSSPDLTRKLGEIIGRVLCGGDVVFLEGPLGAGKTILSQGIGVGLGVKGRVQSPSFVLERIHQGRLRMRHVDLYRLTGDEALESGVLLEPDSETVLVVEWAQKVQSGLSWTLRVRLERMGPDEDERTITLWGEKAPDVHGEFQRESHKWFHGESQGRRDDGPRA